MHEFIFYSSYLAIPVLLGLIIIAWKFREILTGTKLFLFCGLLLANILFIYARFIEPQIIITRETEIPIGFSAKIVVISDSHLGVYKKKSFLSRVVDQINQIKNVDAVVIPGDFTYYPPDNLENLFADLARIKVPVYAVLGNHDSEKPGPPIQKKLQKALENNGVKFLHNSAAEIPAKKIKILGLGDNWAHEDKVEKIDDFKETDNLIVLTHNPDTTLKYENNLADLTISGHTHGGQIRIPFLYQKMIPCTGDFDRGLYETKHGKVFVTSGIGEVGLPMRFLIPPTVDILNLY